MTNTLTQKDIDTVRELYEEGGVTFAQIAARKGYSERTARRRYAAALVEEQLDDVEFPVLPELDVKVKGNYIPEDKVDISRFKPIVTGGDAIITADWHIPLHDPLFVNTMLTAAKKHKIKKLIIAGDFFNMDEFSNYPPIQPEATIDIEKRDANIIMKVLLKWFDEVILSRGNHDFRLSKKLGFKKTFEECVDWMLSSLSENEKSRLKVTSLDYMLYWPQEVNKGRQFRICHQKDYSDRPLVVARDLAVKYGCSIMTAHSHHCAIGSAPNGHDILIECGGFFDKHRTEYIQQTTKHHEWVQGFTIFEKGLPTLISPVFGNDYKYRKGGD